MISKFSIAGSLVVLCVLVSGISGTCEDDSCSDEEYYYRTYGSQVAIKKGNRFICSGLIVNAKTILTSAKCLHKKDTEQLSVHAGTLNHSSGGQVSQVSNVIVHPQFKLKTMKNDLALFTLKTPLQMVYAVELANFDLETFQKDEIVILTGWGSTDPQAKLPYPNHLYEVEVQAISNEKCQEFWSSKNVTIHQTQMCTFTEGKGACEGDEGGPVINRRAKIVGLISYFPQPCASGLPDVHTRIQPYLKWIKENTEAV